MSKPIVLVDMDGIIADLHGPWVWWINMKFGLHLTGEDLTDYWLPRLLPQLGDKVYGFLNKKGIYTELNPFPGAIEALQVLHAEGYDVCIATAPARQPDTAADKLRWLKQHLPWIKRQNIFLGHRKELIWADVFIDDSPDNLIKYREAWLGHCKVSAAEHYLPVPYEPLILTIDWPYNRTAEVDRVINYRAYSYDDTVEAWGLLLDNIRTCVPVEATNGEQGEKDCTKQEAQ